MQIYHVKQEKNISKQWAEENGVESSQHEGSSTSWVRTAELPVCTASSEASALRGELSRGKIHALTGRLTHQGVRGAAAAMS